MAPAFLDECVDHHVVALLRQRGYLVTSSREEGTLGRPDADQLERATQLGRVLISHNTHDFRRLHLSYQAHGRLRSEALEAFPDLTAADVDAALGYYATHQQEIDTNIEQLESE